MTAIKTTDLYNKIVEVANKNPNTIYPERVIELFDDPSKAFPYETFCNYVVNNKPACIVGVALHELGMSIDKLKELDDYYGGIGTVFEKIEESVIECDGMESAIKNIQCRQDDGFSWGVCVSRELE